MNLVILNGRIGKEPETFSAGVRFSVATSSHYKGEEKTQWHSITAFGKTAEFVQKFFHKGDGIVIQGTIEYFKKDETSPTYTNIIANQVSFPVGGGKKQNDSSANIGDDDDIPF